MSAKFSSTDAVTGELLYAGEVTKTPQIPAIFEKSRSAGAGWRRLPKEQRIEVIRRFARYVTDHRDEIADLITREIGKPSWDAAGEVSASIAKIELSISALQKRRSDHIIDSTAGSIERHVRFRPLGVSLVLGPFNFPLHLPGGQIIPALLAGNSVIFKPSDQATAVGAWMVNAWHEVGLPSDVLQMIIGGVETAVAAIDSPDVNAVFLTGSRAAGRAIHRQLAGRPEVMLALELGGNNPIVIADPIDAKLAANIASFSAFVSAGQRCTCARRVILVRSESSELLVQELIAKALDLRVGIPGDEPVPQIGPLISARAAEELQATYRRLINLGCNPLVDWRVDDRLASLVYPCILDATELDSDAKEELGEMEWFGPLLVVEREDNFAAAVAAASQTTYGLAACLLGGTREMFDRFVDEVGAGVVNWNGPTTGAAGALPFGGLGASGNHRPAGFYAIDFCSDPVASLQQMTLSSEDPWSVAK